MPAVFSRFTLVSWVLVQCDEMSIKGVTGSGGYPSVGNTAKSPCPAEIDAQVGTEPAILLTGAVDVVPV